MCNRISASIAASISRIFAHANDADIVGEDTDSSLINDLRQFYMPHIDDDFNPAPDYVHRTNKQGGISRADPEMHRFMKEPAEPEDSLQSPQYGTQTRDACGCDPTPAPEPRQLVSPGLDEEAD
eukprot:1461612-Pyramimonas_sp.AAC.1